MDEPEQVARALSEVVEVSNDYTAWLLEKPSRTSNTLTEWCNARLAHGLPMFPSGWNRHD